MTYPWANGLKVEEIEAYYELVIAKKEGAAEGALHAAAAQHRRAQWRLDFVAAENSMGFHAPQELARILGEVIDHARQGQLEAERTLRKR